jgi:hypothetical protein
MQYITQSVSTARSTQNNRAPSRRRQTLPSIQIVKEQPIDASEEAPINTACATLIADSSSKAVAGGANRDRTDDLLLAKQALSQLSYGPRLLSRGEKKIGLVGLGGLEPPTPRLSSVCSNQLSYRPRSHLETKGRP